MALNVKCPKCSQETSVKGSYNDRGEMAKKLGDEIDITCSHCLKKSMVNVADVRASESKAFKLTVLIACLALLLIFFVLGNPYLFASSNPYYVATSWFFFLSPVIIYTVLIRGHKKNVFQFNRYRN